jgi:hypothetical protein
VGLFAGYFTRSISIIFDCSWSSESPGWAHPGAKGIGCCDKIARAIGAVFVVDGDAVMEEISPRLVKSGPKFVAPRNPEMN